MIIIKRWIWLWLMSQFSLIWAQAVAEQNFFPEAPLEFKNGILFSIQITIGFDNHSVIKNITDAENVAGNQIKAGAFKSCITTFCTTRNINLEDICLKRGIPSWPAGMVTVTDRNNGDIKPAVDLSLVYMLRFPQMIEVELLCDVLKKIEGISYAHPPVLIGILATPNDTYYANQWYFPQIQAPQAWDITRGVDTIRIAIIDARAVCQTHPDLQAKIKGGDGQTRTLEYEQHGTTVAGVAAGITNNALGIAGLGWYNDIITYETPTGQITEDDLLATKIVQAAQPSQKVRVINLSFHIGKPDSNHYSWCTYKKGIYSTRIIVEGPDGDFPEIESAITNAINSGIIVVAAGGNTQSEFYCYGYCGYTCPGGIYGPIWPAAYPGVIGVSGTNESDVHVQNYNYGSHIDVCAPATNIKTTMPPDQYTNQSLTGVLLIRRLWSQPWPHSSNLLIPSYYQALSKTSLKVRLLI